MSQIPKALMEVEVKLRLLDAAAHRQVTTLLAPFLVATHRQENFFFDGSKAELSARLAALRLRFSDRSPLCAVTLKARAVLVDGVSRVEEDEEELDQSIGRACVAEPDKLMAAESRVLRRVRKEIGVQYSYSEVSKFATFRAGKLPVTE